MDQGGSGGGTESARRVTDDTAAARVADLIAAVTEFVSMDTSALTTDALVTVLRGQQQAARLLAGQAPTLVAQLQAADGLTGFGRSTRSALIELLSLGGRDATRLATLAEKLGPRHQLGQVLAPEFEHMAAAMREGNLTDGHLTVLLDFFDVLPAHVDAATRVDCEKSLVAAARTLTPSGLKAVATRLSMWLDQDGPEPDDTPAPQPEPFLHLGPQDVHGYSKGKFYIDAECRLLLETIFATWARPGMNNPADAEPTERETAAETETLAETETETETLGESPTTTEQPPGTVPDTRSVGQRQHDALLAVLRSMLASGKLTHHRGSPVKAVITVRLTDLERRTGLALSNTGTVLTSRDAIRLAAHTNPYLLLLGDHDTPLMLGRTKRIATHHQRLALLARDRGCTFPGCTRPATHCQTHHTTDWAKNGCTDIDQLTFACDHHHALVGDGPTRWATSVAPPGHDYAGRTLWHPPSGIDPTRTGRINLVHHPEDLLQPTG